MSKKTSKKPVTKPARRSAAKPTAKPAARRSAKPSTRTPAVKGPAAKAKRKSAPQKPGENATGSPKGSASMAATAHDPTAPVPVSTGSGASVAEIGGDLVALFNAGQFSEVERKWWSPEIVSCEGMGVNAEWQGRHAAQAKNAWWYGENQMIGASAEGPYLGASGFAVKFRMEYKVRATDEVKNMAEVGVYTVLNGKIAREEFMYIV